MTQFYDLFFGSTKVNWTGDDAITFLTLALIFIMLFSLILTNWITNPQKESKGKSWVQVPTSTNIKNQMNKF